MDSYFPSELELPFTKDAHLGAWSPTVDNLRPQTIHEEPGAAALVLLCFQTPSPFVSDGILVEAFVGCTTCFTNSNRRFTKASKDFNEVDDS